MSKPELIRQLLRFGVVGGAVTLAFVSLNWWFGRLGWSENAAYLAAYPLAVALHFCLNKWWTFRDQRVMRTRQVSEYLLMMLLAFIIQTAVFKFLTHFTTLEPWLASGAATIAQMALSFLSMHRRIFALRSAASA